MLTFISLLLFWWKSSFVWREQKNLYPKSNKPGKSSTKAYRKDIQCQNRKGANKDVVTILIEEGENQTNLPTPFSSWEENHNLKPLFIQPLESPIPTTTLTTSKNRQVAISREPSVVSEIRWYQNKNSHFFFNSKTNPKTK